MKDPLVSVILPCYNAEKYVKEALISILCQTFSDFEVLLINDCSTDNTEHILLEYAARDNRILYIKNDRNLGLIESLNRGIRLARGKYIARMDADDISFEHRFEKQVEKLESNSEIVICGGGIISFYADKNLRPHNRLYPVDTDQIKAEALYNTPFAHPCVMIRRNILTENQLFYDEKFKYSEDYHLWQRLIMYGESANIKDYLLKYRVLDSSQTANGIKDQDKRFERISAIQSIALNRINCKLNEKQLKFHYLLSLSDYIRQIDFSIYNYRFIQEYFREIDNSSNTNNYCTNSSIRKVLQNKYLKLVAFNYKRIGFFNTMNFVLTARFFHAVKRYIS